MYRILNPRNIPPGVQILTLVHPETGAETEFYEGDDFDPPDWLPGESLTSLMERGFLEISDGEA